jgi:hypothetical protein
MYQLFWMSWIERRDEVKRCWLERAAVERVQKTAREGLSFLRVHAESYYAGRS